MNIANKIGSTFVSNKPAVCRVVIGDDVEIVINDTTNSETRSLRQVIEMPPVTDEEPEHVKQRITQYVLEGDLTEEEAQAIAALYPVWDEGIVITQDDIDNQQNLLFRHGSTVYRAIQPHTTQSDWPPDITPALWVKAVPENVIPVWFQPSGAHDAWPLDALVQWPEGGTVWRSTIPANTTEPGTLSQLGYWVVAE